MTLHQIVAGFRLGDAISNEAVLIRDICAAHGVPCDIYCLPATTHPDDSSLVKDAEALPRDVRSDDVALLHLSIGSEVNRIFAGLPCRKVILYHNVTPPRFFERLNASTAQVLANGLKEVAALKDVADDVWAVSAFNAGELRAMGYRSVRVFPLLLDVSGPAGGPVDPGMTRMLGDPLVTNLLFVGRLAPNKRHDRLLEIFFAYHRTVDSSSRLVIVGGSGGAETYKALLMGAAYALAVKNVVFTEFVDDSKLRACYATASAFVCTSEHEGFCAPILEAMAWRIPVFAAAACAIPETMDGAGVLFAPDAPPEVAAEAIGRVLRDRDLREAVLRRQDERVARFRARDAWAELQALLAK